MKNIILIVILIVAAVIFLSILMSSWIPVIVLLVVLAVGLLFTLLFFPALFEKNTNKVLEKSPYTVDEKTQSFHNSLFVVDLHADPLLWKRNLLKRYDYAHIDVPRLLEGNVGFQVYGVVTKSPQGQNFSENDANALDMITVLSMVQSQPIRTWNNLYQRAVYQAQKLYRFAEKSNGKLMVVGNQSQLAELLKRKKAGEQVTGGFLMLEGAHGLDGKLENIDNLFDYGFRILGITHFFDNQVGGSAHGIKQGGLTSFGSEVVKRAQEKHMIIDLAHASPLVIDDILEITNAPVIASHTGVKGTYDSPRNLSDEHIKKIAATGGVMGIAWFDEAVGECSFKAVVKAIRYTASLVGVDAVAVGGDLDGSVTSPVDISGMPLLTEALLKDGFTEDEIAKIMGLNALRVFQQTLPE